MIAPAVHAEEELRLRALLELELLDTPPEQALDQCVAFVARWCGTSAAAISLIDRERQWFKAIYGELPPQTGRAVSFCGHAIAADDVLVVPDATRDVRFADNPLVVAGGIRFYAGVPLHGRDGLPLGTLCIIDRVPHDPADDRLARLRVVADHVEQLLMLRLAALKLAKRAVDAESAAAAVRQVDEERRAVTEMIVHDLKNPLAVLAMMGQTTLDDPSLPPHLRQALEELLTSVATAERIVVDALDVSKSESAELRGKFTAFDLVASLRGLARRLGYLARARGQTVELFSDLEVPVIEGDSVLILRAVRNLLDNALKYGPEARPIRITIAERDPGLEVRVEDDGEPVPEALREKIFDRYYRIEQDDAVRPSHGLGLAFCALVAELHGGRVWAEPGQGGEGNVFCLSLRRTQTKG